MSRLPLQILLRSWRTIFGGSSQFPQLLQPIDLPLLSWPVSRTYFSLLFEEIRVDPAQRLSSKFDSTSIAQFPVAPDGAMGVRVVDDCAEEHMM